MVFLFNIWSKIKTWMGGEGHGWIVLGVILFAWSIWVQFSAQQEVQKYKQITEIAQVSHTKEVAALRDAYDKEIQALLQVDRQYTEKLNKLAEAHAKSLETITAKQTELFKLYEDNVDVLKQALKEVFALEERK